MQRKRKERQMVACERKGREGRKAQDDGSCGQLPRWRLNAGLKNTGCPLPSVKSLPALNAPRKEERVDGQEEIANKHNLTLQLHSPRSLVYSDFFFLM